MTRLALFLLALVAVFGGAAGLGRAVGPIERDAAEETHSEEAETQAHESGTPAGPVGLSLASNGFRFSPARTDLRTGRAPFVFRIVGARTFDVVHERRLHLIVVRRDLEGFQHLHPRRRDDGSWTTTLRFTEPGVYRAFADFSADGKRTVLGIDLFVSGPKLRSSVEVQIPGPTMSRFGEHLSFDVGATPQPYLGARGHLVVLRAGDLAYIHTHPETDALRFEVRLPSPGGYRAFLQYRTRTGLHVAEFALVER